LPAGTNRARPPRPLASTSRSRPSPPFSDRQASQRLSPPSFESDGGRRNDLSTDDDESNGGKGGHSARNRKGKGKEKGKEDTSRRRKGITILPRRKIIELEDSDDESAEEAASQRKRRKIAIQSKKAKVEGEPIRIASEKGAGNPYFQDRNHEGTRQAWSAEEEALFIDLLARYGKDYKRIMAMHGPQGSRSKKLGMRNNVSLKDKAVNIKKQLMRSGQPMLPGLDEGKSLSCYWLPLAPNS
jgi:hypothetical protein